MLRFNARTQALLEIPRSGARIHRIVFEIDYRWNAIPAGEVVVEGGELGDVPAKSWLADPPIEIEDLGLILLGKLHRTSEPVARPSFTDPGPFIVGDEIWIVHPWMGRPIQRRVLRIVHIRAYVTALIEVVVMFGAMGGEAKMQSGAANRFGEVPNDIAMRPHLHRRPIGEVRVVHGETVVVFRNWDHVSGAGMFEQIRPVRGVPLLGAELWNEVLVAQIL